MATCPKCGTRFPSTVRICTHDGTVLSDEPSQDPQIGKLLDGKYRLDSFLSQGGMGAVYKATHVMLDKAVAVKLIKPELVTSAEIVRRFQREARAASNLNHPNIVAVYDLGQTEDGTLYIAMEYVDGPSLKDVIRKIGPIPVPRIVAILQQVASALSMAHSHNIIHRDLKPHNVMLAKGPNGQEVAKLLDFGIAKTFDEAGPQLTQTGFAMGTPQYMPPEQAAGKEVSTQSDLYSLGVILYEMLTGEVPFDAPTTAAILIKQLTEDPTPPSRRKPDVHVSPALEHVALRCLDKEPARRFPSADAFAEALTRAAGPDADKQLSEAATRIFVAPPEIAAEPVPTRVAPTVPPREAATAQVTRQQPPSAPSAIESPGRAAATAAPAPIVTLPAAPAPAPVAAVSVASDAPNSGTRPTVQAAAVATPAAPSAQKSSRTGLWITLGAVAVLVLAVAAMQMGLVPSGQGPASTVAETKPAPAPSASPAAADAPTTAPAATANPAAVPATPPPAADTPASPPAAPPPAATTPATAATTPATTPATSLAANTTSSATTSRPAPPAAPSAPSAPPAPASAPTTSGATPAPAARTAASAAATTAAPVPAAPARPAAPAPRASNAAVNAAPPAAPARQARAENPTVFFRCEGFPNVCNALRSSLLEAFQKHNLQPVREPGRAAIALTANVDVVQERVSRDFGTPMQTRTYTVAVNGETREGTPVSMPSPRTFSFDAQYGRERLDENARLIASDVAEKIRAYWNK